MSKIAAYHDIWPPISALMLLLLVLYKNLIWVFIFVDAICKVERQAVRMNDVLLVVRHAQHLNLLLIRL
ncbi:hypothetical protein EJB05_15443, partial [Eragrostis curvula]